MVEANNKEAINLAVHFFKGNVALSLAAIVILLILVFMQYIPFFGIGFAIAYAILSFEIQIYLARNIPNLSSSEEMAKVAANTKLGDLLSRHLDIAAGGILGYFTISMLTGLLFMVVFGSVIDMNALRSMDMQSLAAQLSKPDVISAILFFVLIALWLGYFFPAVTGEVMMAESFGAAFTKTFLIFSPKLWKRAFNKEYFTLILLWSIIVFVAAFILSMLSFSILFLPIFLIGIYFLSLYNAAIYLFARNLLS